MKPHPRRAPLLPLPFLVACATAPTPRPPALPGAGFARVEEIATGVTWTQARDTAGPWAVQVLQIDLDRCRPLFRAAKAGPPLSARATTSDLGRDALAAINADFFELPSGMTVGAHVSGGAVLVGPGERPVLAITAEGPAQGPATIQGWAVHRADSVRIQQVNRRAGPGRHPDGAGFFTYGGNTDSVGTALLLRRSVGELRAGRATVIGPPKPPSAGPGPGEVLIAGDAAWIGRRAAGDTVAWSIALRVEGLDAPVAEAVGAFPTLIRHGRDVLADQPGVRPEFGERRHPRTAVGWNDRSIFWVVVDGRQMPYSDGMSLPELTALFLRLGAREAVNLDGGGSTAMVLRGRVVNRPSDAQGERAVGNALLLERCERP